MFNLNQNKFTPNPYSILSTSENQEKAFSAQFDVLLLLMLMVYEQEVIIDSIATKLSKQNINYKYQQ